MKIEMGVHGTSAVAEYVGPGRLANIDGVHWSDVAGLRKGWGTLFRGVANSLNWFHLAIPTPIAYAANPTSSAQLVSLQSILVNFQTFGTARVSRIHVWAGSARILTRDGLDLFGDFRNLSIQDQNVHQIQRRLEPTMTIGVSVCVTFGSAESNILWQGARASFSI